MDEAKLAELRELVGRILPIRALKITGMDGEVAG